MRFNFNPVLVAPSTIRPVLAGVLALAATITVGARAYAQSAGSVPPSVSATATSDSANGTEKRDDKRRQIGYAAGAAVGLGIALSGRDSGSFRGFGTLGNGSGTGLNTTATRTASGGALFTPGDGGTVVVTGGSVGTPAPENPGGNSFSGGAVTTAGTGITGNTGDTGSAYYGSDAAGTSVAAGTGIHPAVTSLVSAAPADFLASASRPAALSTPTANPEPGEWLAMGMMGASVLGLMLRAKRRAH